MRHSVRLACALLASAALASACAAHTEPHHDDPAAAPDAGMRPVVTRSLGMSGSHSCALRQAGLYCWGQNFAGQLGNGTTEDSSAPVLATGAGQDIVEVVASTGRTCVRRSTGQVACWGTNDYGQIGDGSHADSLTAVAAIGIDDAVQLAIDDGSTCALRASGQIACWGSAPESSPEPGSTVPKPIEGLAGAAEVRGGTLDLYCARGTAGWVRCFKLERGNWTAPAEVAALAGARAIAVTGYDEVCGITANGDLRCHNLDSGFDITLPGSEGSVELVGTSLVACTKDGAGQWSCWNILPTMLQNEGSPAIKVPSDMPLLEVAIGGFNACGLRADRSVACANAATGSLQLTVVSGLPP